MQNSQIRRCLFPNAGGPPTSIYNRPFDYIQGFCSCSFRKNIKHRTLMDSRKTRQIQNDALDNPCATSAERSGKTSPGPTLSGAVARARIVPIEPMTWAARSVKVMWNRVRVLRRIIPNPIPDQRRELHIILDNTLLMLVKTKLTDALKGIQKAKPKPEHPSD